MDVVADACPLHNAQRVSTSSACSAVEIVDRADFIGRSSSVVNRINWNPSIVFVVRTMALAFSRRNRKDSSVKVIKSGLCDLRI